MKSSNLKILLSLLLLTSCAVKSNYCGKYTNTYNEKVINYLILYRDNTYLHYYDNNSIKLSQKGKWKISDNNNYSKIDLFDFCDYNEEGVNFKKFGIYFLIKDGKYLNPGYDGEVRGSFEKESARE